MYKDLYIYIGREMPNYYVRINLALPQELGEWVKEEAKKENRSINNFIATVLLEKKRQKERELMQACISKQS